MAQLNKTNFQIKFKQGLSTNINGAITQVYAATGEPHYTTDTKKLYVYDGSNNERVHGLDMAITFEGDIIINEGEIIWLI